MADPEPEAGQGVNGWPVSGSQSTTAPFARLVASTVPSGLYAT